MPTKTAITAIVFFAISLVSGIAARSVPEPQYYTAPDFKGALEKSLK